MTASNVGPVPFAADSGSAALERMNRFQEPAARALIADLQLPGGSRGLDVGCGVGLYALWLAQAVGPRGQVVGVEASAERLEAARTLVQSRRPASRLDLRAGDATALDFPDSTFDWVWCGDVLHHVVDTVAALREFARVVKPGGRIVIKESQLLPALFLPGHPELERRIQQAEMEGTLEEGAGRSFQERRQRTRESLLAAGLGPVDMRTHVIERQTPLADADRDYVQGVVFERNWGERLRDRLAPTDWDRRSALCEADSPEWILGRADYYCIYPITVFATRTPA